MSYRAFSPPRPPPSSGAAAGPAATAADPSRRAGSADQIAGKLMAEILAWKARWGATDAQTARRRRGGDEQGGPPSAEAPRSRSGPSTSSSESSHEPGRPGKSSE